MILKVGEGIQVKYTPITTTSFEKHCDFRNETWGEDVTTFDSYTGLIHDLQLYLLTITEAFFGNDYF